MVKMFSYWRSLFLILALAPAASHAQLQKEYFRANVPVKTQTANERRQAAQKAFLQVILRVSGFESALADEQIRSKARRAQLYIEQYQYRPLEAEDLLAQGYRELLSLTFSRAAVEKLLRDTRQAIWSNRPRTLLWLVEDDPQYGKQLLNQQSAEPIIGAIAAAAQRRGLPLAYPLLDLDDQLALKAEDVWDVNEQAIAEASQRYGVDAILVGRYSTTSRGELWSIWQFFHAGTSLSYDGRIALEQDDAFATLGRAALDPLADFLAQRYAIQPQLEAGGRWVVQISGIGNFAAYRRSLNYLEGLGAVSDVKLAAVRQDTLLLYLESQAGVETFMKVLALDNKLRPASAPETVGPVWQQAPRGTLDNPLRFSWSS